MKLLSLIGVVLLVQVRNAYRYKILLFILYFLNVPSRIIKNIQNRALNALA